MAQRDLFLISEDCGSYIIKSKFVCAVKKSRGYLIR